MPIQFVPDLASSSDIPNFTHEPDRSPEIRPANRPHAASNVSSNTSDTLVGLAHNAHNFRNNYELLALHVDER